MVREWYAIERETQTLSTTGNLDARTRAAQVLAVHLLDGVLRGWFGGGSELETRSTDLGVARIVELDKGEARRVARNPHLQQRDSKLLDLLQRLPRPRHVNCARGRAAREFAQTSRRLPKRLNSRSISVFSAVLGRPPT